MKSRILKMAMVLGFASFGTLAGCKDSDVTLRVTHYPTFFNNSQTYDSMAVAYVENYVEPGRYSINLGNSLVSGVASNGWYRVENYTRTSLTDDELMDQLYETASSNLVVFSTLTDYGEYFDSHYESYTESETYYLVDEYGNYIYDEDGYRIVDYIEEYEVDYPVYEHTSYAEIYVRVIDTAKRQTVLSRTSKGVCYEEVEDPFYFSDTESSRWCAFDEAIADEIFQICPTNESIHVNKNKLLKIYRLDEDNLWEKESSFSSDDRIKLEFWFPESAYYNTFHFDIVYGKNDTLVTSDDLYWEGRTIPVEYEAAELLDASRNAKNYRVRLWNGNRVVMKKKFKINK